jgi:hypothetical protein
MSDLDPHGLPKDLLQRIELLRPIIQKDHPIIDHNLSNGQVTCACGTVVSVMDYTLHLNNETARIIDLET